MSYFEEYMLDLKEMRNQAQIKRDNNKISKEQLKEYNDRFDVCEKMVRNAYGDDSKGSMTIQEAITTTDTMQLIPKVIEGKMREASEPQYIGTQFFKKVKVDAGPAAVYVIPVTGELIAYEVGEGERYNESAFDQTTIENATLQIKMKKFGCRVSITEEAVNDSSWDILGINLSKMGRAMARIKEEQIFKTFSSKGHPVFDNLMAAQHGTPERGTTGLDKEGHYNGTLSVEDFLDLAMVLLGQGFNPTDVIMHPLVWVVFARNSMIGNGLTYGALGGNYVHPNGGIQGTPAAFGMANSGDGQKFIMKPEQIQNRLPVMGLAVSFSPWVKFDKMNKLFDCYCLDRNEVGILAQREELSLDNWTDPERDIRLIKAKERYGIGILNNGRAITVARNIAVATSYPAQPVINVRSTESGTGYPQGPTN